MQTFKTRTEFPEMGTLTDSAAKERLEEAYARFQKSIGAGGGRQPKYMFSYSTPESAVSFVEQKIREQEKQPQSAPDWKFLEECRKKIGEKTIGAGEVEKLRGMVKKYYPDARGQSEVLQFLVGTEVAGDLTGVFDKAANHPKAPAIIERMLDQATYRKTALDDNWENDAPGGIPMPQATIANPIAWIVSNQPSSKWEKSLLDLETKLKKADAGGLLDISAEYMQKK